jgi:membrane protein YqaA with SNARE-associated domain
MGFLDGDTVQHLLAHYGYAAVFLVVMLESAGIPMPGETILISAAVLAGTKHALDIRWVIAAAAGGAIVGDNVGFWAGREFGEPLLERWAISSGSTHESECLADICSPATVARSSSLAASLLCFGLSPRCSPARTDWPLGDFLSSTLWVASPGPQFSDWAATCWVRAFIALPGPRAG